MEKKDSFFKKHKKLIIWMIILAIVIALVIWCASCVKKASGILNQMSNSAATAEVEARDIVHSVNATGYITSLSLKQITTPVTGVKVTSVNVNIGDIVKAGDVICTFDDSDFKEKLEEANESLENTQKLSSIEKNSVSRSYNNTVENAGIQKARADENVNKAYGKYEEQAGKADEAWRKYCEGVENTKSLKEKSEQAQKDYEDYVKNRNDENDRAKEIREKFEGRVDDLYKYLNSLISEDPGVNPAGALAITLENATSVTLDKLYTGENQEVAAEVLSQLTKIAKAAVKYYDEVTPIIERHNKKQAELQATYENLVMEYQTAQKTEEALKASFDSLNTAKETYLDTYNQTVQTRDDLERSNAFSIANSKDSVNTNAINSENSTKTARKNIEAIEEQISDCVVTATSSGVITALNVEAGESFVGGAIANIEDISSFEVTAYIDEYDISKIKPGQKVNIKTNATNDLVLDGVVKTVAPRATQGMTSVSYEVVVGITTPCDDLRLDMTAKLEIVIEESLNALSVPFDAIMVDDKGDFYVEVLDGGAPIDFTKLMSDPNSLSEEDMQKLSSGNSSYESHKVYVTKGLEGDYYVEVFSDELKPGMVVVIPKDDMFSDINLYMDEVGAAGGINGN